MLLSALNFGLVVEDSAYRQFAERPMKLLTPIGHDGEHSEMILYFLVVLDPLQPADHLKLKITND